MEAKKTVVYICSKYRGDVGRNTEMAKRYCRHAVDLGYIPIAPHLYLPGFIDEATERDLALSIGIGLLDTCSEIWVCGPEVSEGMAAEIAHAKKQGITIKYVSEEDLACTQ